VKKDAFDRRRNGIDGDDFAVGSSTVPVTVVGVMLV
jgi:hypothetical protein